MPIFRNDDFTLTKKCYVENTCKWQKIIKSNKMIFCSVLHEHKTMMNRCVETSPEKVTLRSAFFVV